jgi:hypothetical protein
MDLINRTWRWATGPAKFDIAFTALIILFCALMAIQASEAKCAWCPTYKCFGANSCGASCMCVTGPGGNGGNCYSIE